MKAIAKTKENFGFEIIDTKEPTPGKDEVILKVKRCSICGTDLHIYKWDEWIRKTMKLPKIVGHEVCGEIVEVGKEVKKFKNGDIVSVESHFVCHSCPACRKGNYRVCYNTKILGIDIDGAYAEYVKVPAFNLWKNEIDLPEEVLSLKEPFGNAVDTVLTEDVSGKSVLILGSGPLGMMAILISKHCGAYPVFVTEVKDYRIKKSKELGADYVINPLKENLYEFIKDHTKGEGVDVLIEMSGNQNALEEGLRCLSPDGRASLLGIFEGSVNLDFNKLIVLKNIRIYGITGRGMFSTWFKVDRLLNSGLDLRRVITHTFKMEEIDEAMKLMGKGECGKISLLPFS
ncbi:MAG: L-threonine 3-dehydrogenase [Candidatus Hydrothermales bacterium]